MSFWPQRRWVAAGATAVVVVFAAALLPPLRRRVLGALGLGGALPLEEAEYQRSLTAYVRAQLSEKEATLKVLLRLLLSPLCAFTDLS